MTRKEKKKPLDDLIEKFTLDHAKFQEEFPNLYEEIAGSGKEKQVSFDKFQSKVETQERPGKDLLHIQQATGEGRKKNIPEPTVVDFIQRCNTIAEAREIIDFLTKQGEVSNEQREELLEKLESEGIRAFGNKRSWGHYERRYRAM